MEQNAPGKPEAPPTDKYRPPKKAKWKDKLICELNPKERAKLQEYFNASHNKTMEYLEEQAKRAGFDSMEHLRSKEFTADELRQLRENQVQTKKPKGPTLESDDDSEDLDNAFAEMLAELDKSEDDL